ncbi:MAG TPA: DUF2235 domain-containing protein [Acidiferrobacterales bacterium]|nr:DUF2235 domain-containing protein [Acidiferrobacterales bacterium]
MARKLTVLFDGTWNTTKDRANCVRLSKLIDTTSSDGDKQLPPFYDKGVGTHARDRPSGARRPWPPGTLTRHLTSAACAGKQIHTRRSPRANNQYQ